MAAQIKQKSFSFTHRACLRRRTHATAAACVRAGTQQLNVARRAFLSDVPACAPSTRSRCVAATRAAPPLAYRCVPTVFALPLAPLPFSRLLPAGAFQPFYGSSARHRSRRFTHLSRTRASSRRRLRFTAPPPPAASALSTTRAFALVCFAFYCRRRTYRRCVRAHCPAPPRAAGGIVNMRRARRCALGVVYLLARGIGRRRSTSVFHHLRLRARAGALRLHTPSLLHTYSPALHARNGSFTLRTTPPFKIRWRYQGVDE